jgi:hypothetical protein
MKKKNHKEIIKNIYLTKIEKDINFLIFYSF